MSYVLRTLLSSEHITYKAELHWWIFVLPVSLIGLGLYLICGGFHISIVVAGWLLLIPGVVSLIARIILLKTSEYVVTNRRVILKKGLIRREVSDLQLCKAEAIAFDESIAGRVFGFGRIIVTTGGMTQIYPYIASPSAFRKAVHEAIDHAAVKGDAH